jgi:hypothetical protein
MSHPAGTNPSRPRPIAQVNPKLDKNLAAYMAAAGAAGVSMLALAQPAEAKIVFTPAHTMIPLHGSLPLDLNNDGVNDFIFSNSFYGHASHLYIDQLGPANQVFHLGAALPAGVRIGNRGSFVDVALMAFEATTSGITSSYSGPWKDAHQRFLGLKFSVNGETHYGWARLTVTAKGGISATLTGYAYETVPNKPIITGKIFGQDGASVAAPEAALAPSDQTPTLGTLARGADAVAIWRRDDEVAAR